MPTPPRRLDILFVLLHPGYVRFFDGAIAALVKKGCLVRLAFVHVHKKMSGLDGISFDQPALTIDGREMPKRRDRWQAFALYVRSANDYLHYLTDQYREAQYLRRRIEKDLPQGLRWLRRLPILPTWLVLSGQSLLRYAESLVPPVAEAERYFSDYQPDLVVVSPLVEKEFAQIEILKAAHAKGIPVALAVGSWDHLTTKRCLSVRPDKIIVWNEQQRREAVRIHAAPPDDVAVTGAPAFDRWFDRKPTMTRAEFCAHAGLPNDGPYVMYAGSSPQIVNGPAELDFARGWRAALVGHLPSRHAGLNILVRPHPVNHAHWQGSTEIGSVFPLGPANPTNKRDQQDYFHSIYYASAVIGLNTSATIEAAILGKPVFAILAGDKVHQLDTLHFRLLLPENGGCLHLARTLDEHVRQLVKVLDEPSSADAALRDFVSAFVRPRGLEQRAVVPLTRVIVDLARVPRRPRRAGLFRRAMTALIGRLLAGREPTSATLEAAARASDKRMRRFAAEVKLRRGKIPAGMARTKFINPFRTTDDRETIILAKAAAEISKPASGPELVAAPAPQA